MTYDQPRKSAFPPTPASACRAGVDIFSNAVKITLGPKGRKVIIDKSYGARRTNKDGVTVAKEIGSESRRTDVCGARQLGASTTPVSPQGDLR